ncbi:MAG TPA: TM0106 family RecB-like putative nuclease [Planctomycetota bacterium]|nr:TM0106 family RecB-like putative nuclease [Planctomycetota bacterium]
MAEHLACPHATALRRAQRELGAAIEYRSDPRVEALRERGAAHERAFVARLADAGKRVVALHDEQDAAATLAAMRAGADAIVQAPLAGAGMRGVADVLLRVAAPSDLGSWSYEPYDTKLARRTRAGTVLQLACYAEMLAAMQGVAPAFVHVVTPIAVESHRPEEYAAYVRLVQRRYAAALAAPPAYEACPDPVEHCEVCGYYAHCDRVRRAADHLCLVAGLSGGHRRELVRQGITGMAALADCSGRLPEAPRRGSPAVYVALAEQARLQRQARLDGMPPVVTLPVEPGRGLCRLPEPTAGDVFLDLEGDPYACEGGREYLLGWITADEPDVHHALWSFDAAAERRALETFLDAVAVRLAREPGMHVYHFGAYDRTAIARLVQRHGTRADLLDVLLRGERFVDLHRIVRQALRIGVESYGLKGLEVLTGFERQVDLSIAAHARRRVEIGLATGDPDVIDPTTRLEVEIYNEDDCASARELRAWLEEQRAALERAGTQVPRPSLSDGTAPAGTVEHERRIERVAAALRARTDGSEAERRAAALLADQLGYFRRETKCAWWDYFRLRECEADELQSERDAIVGLRHVGELPRRGRETRPRHEYEFPPQDTTLAAGDYVYLTRAEDPGAHAVGTRLGQVVSCDPDRGRLVVAHSAACADLRPSALIAQRVVKTGALADALLELGEHVQTYGFRDCALHRAAVDLLLRRPPHAPGDQGDALQRPGESELAAALRMCRLFLRTQGGLIAVQGPPGSGKSTLGAGLVAALAREGKRVGVTAVSHAVIDALLEKAAEAHGVRCVHYRSGESAKGAAGVEYVADKDEALATLGQGTVVGGTAWMWAAPQAHSTLDVLVVDEAGQMSLAHALAAARSTRRLVLIGDPRQLEQPRRGAHPDGADVAALVHWIGERDTMPPELGLFLGTTRRLHPRLCAFTSATYYEGRLAAADGLERQCLSGGSRFAGAGLFLVEVAHEGNQARAPEEVEAITAIARELLAGAMTYTAHDGSERPLEPKDVLVIAPYNAQVAALRTALEPLGVRRVGTVDRFQGQEAPVVVYSCTSSSALDAPRGMDFLFDPHRFNVATSRARATVIVVASPALFTPDCRTPAQMRMANGLCRFRELATVFPA